MEKTTRLTKSESSKRYRIKRSQRATVLKKLRALERGTVNPRNKKKRRSKARLKPFENSPIGAYILSNAPFDYENIMNVVGRKREPSPDLIENYAYSSNHPAFCTTEFYEKLLLYRRTGCRYRQRNKIRTAQMISAIKASIGM